MRYKFVVNPIAGRGDGARGWKQIEVRAKEKGLDYSVAFTKAPGDGVFLTKEAVKEGYETVVAVGGDGTVNEVVRGIIESGEQGKIALGIVPCGTGNDLVRSLSIPMGIKEAVDVLADANIKKIDLGAINGDHFLNVVGIGFDAAVAYEINTNVRRLKGTAAYLYGVFKTLFQWKSPRMVIQIDEQELQDRYFLVAIANAKYYGGGMMIAPAADLEDGLLDIYTIKDVKPLEVIKVLPTIFSGKHVNHWAVSHYRGKKIEVSSPDRVIVQADGELKGTLPMNFTVEAKVFPVIVPK